MSNILLILVSFFGGLLLKKGGVLKSESNRVLNTLIIYLSLPAITLYYVPQLAWEAEMIYPFAAPFVVLLLAVAFFHALRPVLGYSRTTLGALVLVGGLGNISFVGFPVIEAIYGSEGLEVAVVVSQGGFLAVSVLGVLLASYYSSSENGTGDIWRNVLKFPPFLAFVFAAILAVMGWELPEALQDSLQKLGGTLTPLAMASIGLQIQFSFKEIKWQNAASGLAYKLVIAPALILLLLSFWLPSDGLLAKVTVLESGMPPMVTAYIISAEYQLNEKLASFLVGFGLVASVLTLGLWTWFLG